MSHRTFHPSYHNLVNRLNRFPQGAPPSELFYRILEMLFSEHEAELVAQVPVKPFTAQQAATIWKMDVTAARKILEELASRARLLDMEMPSGELSYVLPPPMAGFFEFSMMRLRGDVDQKALGELFYQYIPSKMISFARSLPTAKPSSVAHSSRKQCSPSTTRCTCSIMSARVTSSILRPRWASA